jgi:UDP-glucose:tetrahydrobiopterin glucosyltransferase
MVERIASRGRQIPREIILRMRILFVSTPVSPIGAGGGGGVETTLRHVASGLGERGHAITVIAPAGSCLPGGMPICQVSGAAPSNATTGARNAAVTVRSTGVLERMWEQAGELALQHDVIVAMTYDWLSFYLTPFLPIPVLHWVHLPSLIEAVDLEMCEQYCGSPERFAFCSRTQASTFSFVDLTRARIIPGAVDTDGFPFRRDPKPALVWAARISPEKGLEDAVQVARETGWPLHVCGKIEDQDYWRRIRGSAAEETIVYHGWVPHDRLSEVLGSAAAMLVTPKWMEAFGLTVIEALACGTPVIAYQQGGPGEIIEHGKSGFLVPPNDVRAMTDAVGRVRDLQRADARRRAEDYSIGRMAETTEEWLMSALQAAD